MKIVFSCNRSGHLRPFSSVQDRNDVFIGDKNFGCDGVDARQNRVAGARNDSSLGASALLGKGSF